MKTTIGYNIDETRCTISIPIGESSSIDELQHLQTAFSLIIGATHCDLSLSEITDAFEWAKSNWEKEANISPIVRTLHSNDTVTLMPRVAEQATGCPGAGSYLDFAREHGFTHIEVLNWTSSAGDWQFLVSANGNEWQILYQTNNYPKSGFSHELGEEVYVGSYEEVAKEIYGS